MLDPIPFIHIKVDDFLDFFLVLLINCIFFYDERSIIRMERRYKDKENKASLVKPPKRSGAKQKGKTQ